MKYKDTRAPVGSLDVAAPSSLVLRSDASEPLRQRTTSKQRQDLLQHCTYVCTWQLTYILRAVRPLTFIFLFTNRQDLFDVASIARLDDGILLPADGD